MKSIKVKGLQNTVELTGIIQKMDEFVRYIPNPIVGFDLSSNRKRKSVDAEWVADLNRIIVFDQEDLLSRFAVGDRVRVKGELQSRNYTRDKYDVDEQIQNAVDIFTQLYEKAPTKKQPKGRVRQPIEWKQLLDMNLIGFVPEDSMFREDGSKEKSPDTNYVYRVDENFEVYKETEHVAYEVIAFSVTLMEEEMDELQGDVNRATIIGKITRDPSFDVLKVPFSNSNIQTHLKYFKDQDRVAYANFIAWSQTAEDLFGEVKRGDLVKIVGRLQSRTYTKTVIERWKTPAGNRKKREVERSLITREISTSKLYKAELLPDEHA